MITFKIKSASSDFRCLEIRETNSGYGLDIIFNSTDIDPVYYRDAKFRIGHSVESRLVRIKGSVIYNFIREFQKGKIELDTTVDYAQLCRKYRKHRK